MKKITSLLLFLLVSVWGSIGAMAQVTDLDDLSNSKSYTLEAVRGFFSVSSNGKAIYGKTGTVSSTDANNQFVIYKAGDSHYYLYNVGTGLFVSPSASVASGHDYPSLALKSYRESYFSINPKTREDAEFADYPWYFTVPDNQNYFVNMGGSLQFVVDSWSTQDKGNLYKFTEAADFDESIVQKQLQISNEQVFYIKCERGYLRSSADHTSLVTSDRTTTPDGDDYKFVFYKDGRGVLNLWNVGAGKFVRTGSGTSIVLSADAQEVGISGNSGNADFPYVVRVDGSKINHNNNNGAGSAVTGWESSDAGNCWDIVAVNVDTDMPKTISLSRANHYLSAENVVGAYSSTDLTALKSAKEAMEASFTEETYVALETAISEMSSKAKISVANNAVYKLKNAHSEKRGYLVYDETTPGYPNLASVEYSGYDGLYGQITDANIHSNWGVYTSATSGKQYIYNIDNVKFLKPDAGFNNIDFSEDAVSVTLSDNPNVDYAKSLFWNGSDKALCMACAKGRNNKSAILTNKANDGGRPTYLVYQEGQTVSEDVLKIVEAEVYLYENGADVKGYVGALTDEAYAQGLAQLSGDNRTAANATNVLALGNTESNKNQLQEGGYYRIINAVPGFNKTKGLVWDGNNTVWNTVDKSKVNTIYQIIADNGKYVLKCSNAGKYIQGVMGAMNTNMTDNGHVEFVALGSAQYKVKFGNGTMHALNHGGGSGSGSSITGYDAGFNSASAWYIVPATDIEVPLTTIEDHAYATTCMPFPVSAVNGAKAYTGVVNDAADAITLNEAAGFAANEGVLLMGDANTEKAVLAIGGEATKVDGNVLQGTCSAIALTDDNRADYRVLGANADDASEVGFFRPSSSVTSIPANRAYLNEALFAGLAETLSINFGGMVEGIANAGVAADQVNAPVYDLTGRRVVKAVKGGVYIQNGKKFIVK